MARVTPIEVRDIISVSSTTNISSFILAANAVVDDQLSDAGHSAKLLKEIERWLAAHFVAIHSPGLRSRTVDGAGEVYQIGYLGRQLDATPYGQQVKLLDTSGTLANLGAKKINVTSINFLGMDDIDPDTLQ